MVLSLKKPVIYQPRKHFLSCTQTLICSFLEAYRQPYHWIFSNSWSFYYRSLNSFSATKDEFTSHFDTELKNLYGVELKRFENVPLLDMIEDAVSQNTCLFTYGNTWFIPWHHFHRQQYSPHCFVIKDFNKLSNKVLVLDFIPEYCGWVDFEKINEAYLAGGTHSFKLSIPISALNFNLASEKLSCAYGKMLDGLSSIQKYKKDLENSDMKISPLLDLWWDRIKTIVDLRDGFLEFVNYLDKDPKSPYKSNIDPELILALDKTVVSWAMFRNRVMKSKMTDTFDLESIVGRLEKIFEWEQKSANQLEKIL